MLGRRSGIGKYYEASDKLHEVIGELDGMCESTSLASHALATLKPDVAFCCLGTTMEVAKSKTQFKRVDYYYVTDFAWLCRKFNVHAFSLISSTGASASSPILYVRTKGKAENYIKALNFPATLIYRPGLLGRDEPTSIELCYGKLVSALPAPFFAKVMVTAVEHYVLPQRTETAAQPPLLREAWDNDRIYKFAKRNGISKAFKLTQE